MATDQSCCSWCQSLKTKTHMGEVGMCNTWFTLWKGLLTQTVIFSKTQPRDFCYSNTTKQQKNITSQHCNSEFHTGQKPLCPGSKPCAWSAWTWSPVRTLSGNGELHWWWININYDAKPPGSRHLWTMFLRLSAALMLGRFDAFPSVWFTKISVAYFTKSITLMGVALQKGRVSLLPFADILAQTFSLFGRYSTTLTTADATEMSQLMFPIPPPAVPEGNVANSSNCFWSNMGDLWDNI